MRSQKEDLVNRRKMEVPQGMESKRTNRSIAFLCSNYQGLSCIDTDSLIDLASNRCSKEHRKFYLYITPHGHQSSLIELSRCAIGAHSAGEIPVPIPNTEVKPSSGDNTATAGR